MRDKTLETSLERPPEGLLGIRGLLYILLALALGILVLLFLILRGQTSSASSLPSPQQSQQTTVGGLVNSAKQAAMAEFATAMTLSPENKTPFSQLVQLHLEDGDFEGVQEILDVALENNPGQLWPHQEIVKLYDKNLSKPDAYERSVALWKQAAQLRPDSSWPYLRIAELHQKAKDNAAALGAYEQAIQASPEDANTHFMRAGFLEKQGLSDQALQAYQWSASLEPQSAYYQFIVGRELLEAGQRQTGIGHLESALQLDNSLRMHNDVEKLYAKHLLPEESIASYERIVTINPNDPIAIDILLDQFISNGQCDAALALAESDTAPDALSDNPPSINSYLRLAEVAKVCQEKILAADAYEEAIQIASRNPIGYLELGLLHLEEGDTQGAYELFITAAALDNTGSTYNRVKQAYFNQQELNESIELLRELLKQAKPSVLSPYEDLIALYTTIGQNNQIVPILQMAATAMPNDHGLNFRLAQALYDTGQISASVEYYRQATAQQPEEQTYQLHLGRALLISGELEAGSEILKTVLQNDPNQETYEFIRDLYYNNLTWPDPLPYLEEIALIRWPQTDLAYSMLAQWYTTYGYPDAAIDTYKKVIEVVPNVPKYRIALGRLYFQQGNIEAAEPIFVQALMTDTSDESFQAIQQLYFNQWAGNEALSRLTVLLEQARPSVKKIYVEHVEQSRQLGLSGQALPIWQLAIEALPNDTDLQAHLAREFERTGEIEGAIQTYRQMIEQEPDQTKYGLALGSLLLSTDQPDEGAAILKNALLRNPTESAYTFVRDVYHRYVSLQIAEGNNAAAEALIYQEEIARILWPNPAQAYQRLAQWYLENGQSVQAALTYERMIEITPNDPTSYLALGQLRFDLGETEVATELFTQAIARDRDKGTYRAVQRFYLERLSMEESLDRLQQNLAKAQPTIKQPYIDLINQYKRQEMNEAIIPVLQLALQAFGLDILPEDADLYYLLAEALYEQEEVDAAVGAYRRAATMQPQNQEWQLNYGRALLAGGHMEDGLRTLKGALSGTPSLKTYRFVRDNLHELVEWPQSQAMQEEIAQIYWVQAKKITPAGAYKQLAAWYQEQGQIEAAIATYQNATGLLSGDPTSYLELGLLQFEAGDIAASQTQFQQAVALDTTPKTYRAIQNLYTSKLAPSRAAISLLYLLEQSQPKTLHAYQTLIDFYEDIGDPSQEASILQLAVEAMPDNDKAIVSLADTFYEAGKIEESIPLYRRALTLRPEDPTYGLRLSRSLLNSDEIDTAIAAIEQALRQEPTQQNYEFARELYQESLPSEQLYMLQEKLALIRWPLPSDAYSNLAGWYRDEGKITEAVSAYEDAIAADDTLASLYVDLGGLHFVQGEQEKAETFFIKAVAIDPSPNSSRSIWQFYANNLELNQALASQLNLLAEAKPLHIQPYDDLIEHYQSVGLSSPETTILQIAVNVMSEESQTHFKLAESLYRAELYEQAVVSYQQAVALQPGDSQYRLALGRGLLATEQVDEGVDILQAVLRQTPTKGIYTWVRDAYRETLAWPASEPYQLRAALVYWPNFRQAYQNLATWYVEAAQSDAAISTYQQILEVEQENPDAHEQLTTLYLAQSKCDEASHHALQLARVADDADSYQSLAKTYAQCGPQEAVAVSYQRSMARMTEAEIQRKKSRNIVDVAFRRYGSELADDEIAKLLNSAFLETDFDQSTPYNQLGWYWETIEQAANALPLYQKAVEIEPTNGNNHFTLGRLYHELGDTEQALPEYQRALTLSGIKTQSAHLRYGKALIETGRYDQGAEMLTKGFNLDPSEWALGYVLTQYIENIPPEDSPPYVVDALQLMPLGKSEIYIETFMQPVRVYLEQGYSGTAISLLEVASDMKPKYTWPHVRLFYVYRGLEQPQRAISAIQKAAQADPKDAWVRLTLGNALRRSGDVEQALLELHQAVQLAPEEPWYHIYFGHALFQNNQLDEGQAELRDGLLLASTEEAYSYVNQLYIDYLTAEKVIALYEEILAQHPDDLFAKQYLESWQKNEDSEQVDDAVNAESSR